MVDTSHSIIVQRPDGAAQQLVLLCHGMGADATDMLPLAHVMAREFPQAFIVSVGGIDPCDCGPGRQWFSVHDISETARVERIAAAMPRFRAMIQHWQGESGVGAEGTALVGFSQGAIMALESTRTGSGGAGRVIAVAGRYAQLPEAASPAVTLFLFHGKADGVIPYRHTIEAAERLVALGDDVVAEVLPFVGHEINGEVAAHIIERLTTHIPKRVWDEALRSQPGMH